MSDQDITDPAISGQYELLAIQIGHLKFLEEMNKSAHSYKQALDICRELILVYEYIHQEVSYREPTALHSEKWWHSLHQIQYGADMLHRIENWQTQYEA